MLNLVLWPGSLWAALSDNPSGFSGGLPGAYRTVAQHRPDTIRYHAAVDPALQGPALVADVLKRSSRGHLYHFYTLLCDVATLPGRSTAIWIEDDTESGFSRELDSRHLATKALALVGQEIGVHLI